MSRKLTKNKNYFFKHIWKEKGSLVFEKVDSKWVVIAGSFSFLTKKNKNKRSFLTNFLIRII